MTGSCRFVIAARPRPLAGDRRHGSRRTPVARSADPAYGVAFLQNAIRSTIALGTESPVVSRTPTARSMI